MGDEISFVVHCVVGVTVDVQALGVVDLYVGEYEGLSECFQGKGVAYEVPAVF